MTIEYKIGNLFDSLPASDFIIPHIVNDEGIWGGGFVIPLGYKFPKAKEEYLKKIPKLGDCNLLEVGQMSYVANMCAQSSIISKDNPVPIKYDALEKCLKVVADKSDNLQIHAPAFGSMRAGGDWKIIEQLIQKILCPVAPVFIYTLNKQEQENILGRLK